MSDFLQLHQQGVNKSIDLFLDNMNSILDKHTPLKRINSYKLKFKSKPWITPAIQKSTNIEHSLLKRFINGKDSQTEETFHRNCIDYRNMLSTIFKKL